MRGLVIYSKIQQLHWMVNKLALYCFCPTKRICVYVRGVDLLRLKIVIERNCLNRIKRKKRN